MICAKPQKRLDNFSLAEWRSPTKCTVPALTKNLRLYLTCVFDDRKRPFSSFFLTEIRQFLPPRFAINHGRIKHCGTVGGVSKFFTQGFLHQSSVIRPANAGGERSTSPGAACGTIQPDFVLFTVYARPGLIFVPSGLFRSSPIRPVLAPVSKAPLEQSCSRNAKRDSAAKEPPRHHRAIP